MQSVFEKRFLKILLYFSVSLECGYESTSLAQFIMNQLDELVPVFNSQPNNNDTFRQETKLICK